MAAPRFSPRETLAAAKLNLLSDAIDAIPTGGSTTQPGATATRASLGLASNVPQAQSLTAFGDSITAGYAASTPALSAIGLLGSALGVTPSNRAVSGSQAADQAGYIYPVFSPQASGAQLVTFMVGTNDNWIYNSNVYKQEAFRLFHQAATAYLATPNKLLAQSAAITYAGTWTNAPRYGGAMGKTTAANGATATFTVYGRAVYVAYLMENLNAGTFSVSVDGVTVGTYYGLTSGPPGAVSITTNIGTTFGSALLRVGGLSDGQHTVVVTKTSAGGTLELHWVAGAGGQNLADGVAVVVGQIPRAGTESADLPTFRALVSRNVQQLARDGLPVTLADVPGYLNPATDLIADGVHPNDFGSARIFGALMAAASSQSRAGVMRPPLYVGMPDDYGTVVARGSNLAIAQNCFGSVVMGGDSHQVYQSWNAVLNGRFNVVSGFFATVGGLNSQATGDNSFVYGAGAADRGGTALAFSPGTFAAPGDAQTATRVLRAQTTNATPTRLTTTGAAAGGTNTLNLPNFGAFAEMVVVVAKATGTTDAATWRVNVSAVRGNGPATVVVYEGAGTAIVPTASNGTGSTWRLAVAADTTNGGIALTVTGAAATINTVVAARGPETVTAS